MRARRCEELLVNDPVSGEPRIGIGRRRENGGCCGA
jgi:hypothetical protein